MLRSSDMTKLTLDTHSEVATWKLSEWNAVYAVNTRPMSNSEISAAIKFLRNNNYPKPADCPWDKCPKLRPSCKLSVCYIAVGMCHD